MADTPTIAVPGVREKGYVTDVADGVTYNDWLIKEQVPALRWPYSIGVYSRMVREDPRIASLLAAIGLPVIRTPWRIDQNGSPDEVTEFVADVMALPIVGTDATKPLPRTRGRFRWSRHLPDVLTQNVYGHAVFEQVYRLDPDGRFRIAKLAPRPQHTIMKFETARDGGLEAIVQYAPASGMSVSRDGGTRLPIKRLVVYTRDMDPGQWQGRSLLRPVYKHWLLKDELIRYQAVAIRRNGMGVPVGTSPEGATQDQIDAMAAIAQQYRGGDTAGASLPAGSDLKLLGVQGNLPDIAKAINYHDKSIAIAGLANFLNLDGGGSYALASVQEGTFTGSVQGFAETIRDTAQAHIIEDLVDVNFGPEVQAPRLVFDDIGSQQEANASALKLLVDAKLISPDAITEQALRQRLGLPALDPTTRQESTTDDDA